MLAHVEPSWELCWGHVWAIYVETILRCQLFRPGPLLELKTSKKNEVLQHRQDEILCRRRARNSVKKKNDVFLHRKQKPRKLEVLQSCGSRDGVVWEVAPNPARGPRGPELAVAVALPYGSSLLSERQRGRRPCRRPTPPSPYCTIKNYRGLRCFLLFSFFDSCGLRWVNMGRHRPQDGPP